MEDAVHNAGSDRSSGGLSAVLYVVMVSAMFFMGRSAMSPLLLDVERAFGVSHADSAGLMVMFTIGYGLAMFLSGFASRRIVHRRLVPLTAVVGAAGMVVLSLAGSMAMMRIGLFVFGAGFGVFAPTGINLITTVARKGDWQKAFSINELSPHAGMILAPLLVAALRPILPWRWAFGLLAVLLIAAAAVFQLRVRSGNDYGSAPSPSSVGVLVRKPAFWLLILLFSFALSGTDGVYVLIPTFLVTEAGVDSRIANTVFGISRFMPIIALSIAAFLFDRFGPRYAIAFSLSTAGLATVLLGTASGMLRMSMVFLQPALGALYFPAGFAALASLLPAESRNVGISMVLPVSVVVGVGLLPAFVGYMGDVASFRLGFVILGIATTVVGVGALLARFDSKE